MATYDSSKPIASDPVSASRLQANFKAIEQGNVNHEKLTLAKVTSAPSAVTDKMRIYGFEDTQTEAYARGADGNIIQLTQDGRLGSDSTKVAFDTLSHDDGTTLFNELNMISEWGTFTASTGATIKATAGISCSAAASKVYTITISPVLVIPTGVDFTVVST